MKTSPILTLVLAVVAAAPLAAQSSTRVVPAHNETLVGNESVVAPFGYDSFRSQQIYSSPAIAQTSASITAIAFRSDSENPSSVQIQNVVMSLSHTSVLPQAMNTSFASNVTSTPTAVFSGTVSLPSQTAVPFGPTPFAVLIPFNAPFAYQANQGDLLVDITATNSQPSQRVPYSLDASLPGGTVERYGQNGTGIDNLAIRVGGAGGTTARAGLVPGGGFEVSTSVASWLPDYLGGHVFGLMPAIVDLGPLGATGSFLYVDSHVAVIPHTWMPTFIDKVSIAQVPLPSGASLIGAQLFTQSVMLEQNANNLGIVTTEGLRLVVGDLTAEVTQLVTSNDPTATQGTYYFGQSDLGGVVTQFSGTFN